MIQISIVCVHRIHFVSSEVNCKMNGCWRGLVITAPITSNEICSSIVLDQIRFKNTVLPRNTEHSQKSCSESRLAYFRQLASLSGAILRVKLTQALWAKTRKRGLILIIVFSCVSSLSRYHSPFRNKRTDLLWFNFPPWNCFDSRDTANIEIWRSAFRVTTIACSA